MQRALNMLGLCARAGRVKSGLESVEQTVKAGKAYLALVDAGASDGSQKVIADACKYASIKWLILPEGALGRAIGRQGRMAVAIMDKGFADKISELMDQQRDCGGA